MLGRVWRLGLRASSCAGEALRYVAGRLPAYGILNLEISGELAEEPPSRPLLPFLPPHQDFVNLIALLCWARDGAQLQAVLVRCDHLRIGWARVQELRRSLEALRRAGKIVWVQLTRPGIREYVLACAADQIVLTPAGTLDITGLSSEVTFIAGTLHKLGIQAELVQMGKYKSAAETFTRAEMSDAHREMVESLIEDLYEQVTEAIAAGRRLTPAAARQLLDRGPFPAREAAHNGLVDWLLYEDETEERLRAHCHSERVIQGRAYFARRARAARRAVLASERPSIGLLHVHGPIKTGQSVPGLNPESGCGAASISRDLAGLRDRRSVGAVVVRISSPGGSGLASDLIWHEVKRTSACKPVVISFGDVAASGGYYIAVAGNPVVAEPATITGSIGVLAGKAVLRGLYDQIGITKQIVTRGRHAALYSDYIPLGDDERVRLQSEAAAFYDDFVEKVANGRRLPRERVEAAAEGRVWSGRQALELGLVDILGGLEQALDRAKELAGVPADAPVGLARYPRPRRLWPFSFRRGLPAAGVNALEAWLRPFGPERIWTVLPFHFEFF